MNQDKLTKAEQWWLEINAGDYKQMGINPKDLISMYENDLEGGLQNEL